MADLGAVALLVTCALICDNRGVVVRMNARTLVGSLYSSKLNALKFNDSRSADRYAQLIAEATRNSLIMSATPLSIEVRNSDGNDLVIRAIPLKDHAEYLFSPAAFLLLIKPKPIEHRDWLQQTFRLTAAEMRIVAALCDVISVKEISEVHRVKYYTVRAQLKSIFNKMDVHSQGQLVALAKPYL